MAVRSTSSRNQRLGLASFQAFNPLMKLTVHMSTGSRRLQDFTKRLPNSRHESDRVPFAFSSRSLPHCGGSGLIGETIIRPPGCYRYPSKPPTPPSPSPRRGNTGTTRAPKSSASPAHAPHPAVRTSFTDHTAPSPWAVCLFNTSASSIKGDRCCRRSESVSLLPDTRSQSSSASAQKAFELPDPLPRWLPTASYLEPRRPDRPSTPLEGVSFSGSYSAIRYLTEQLPAQAFGVHRYPWRPWPFVDGPGPGTTRKPGPQPGAEAFTSPIEPLDPVR
ncbi:hypothetical protein B0T10DRAFT_137 [Thelonectria olida]|uniref:Uncharacterized protein n=1 Tax=Thelonectria olida TaxID=1576542 RepID=A0A9P8WJI7_9HYPO|nr:hypothetical protein B0T10DRAFT_137 [Thelonectria olida]